MGPADSIATPHGLRDHHLAGQVRGVASGAIKLQALTLLAVEVLEASAGARFNHPIRLSLQDLQLQTEKEIAVRDADFNVAAARRDSQEDIRKQIMVLYEKLRGGN